jgi:hypothetical protein
LKNLKELTLSLLLTFKYQNIYQTVFFFSLLCCSVPFLSLLHGYLQTSIWFNYKVLYFFFSFLLSADLSINQFWSVWNLLNLKPFQYLLTLFNVLILSIKISQTVLIYFLFSIFHSYPKNVWIYVWVILYRV